MPLRQAVRQPRESSEINSLDGVFSCVFQGFRPGFPEPVELSRPTGGPAGAQIPSIDADFMNK